MNTAKAGHEGSSRSHASMILTLYQLNDGKYLRTEFHLIDLAGAERPGKNDQERSSGNDVMMKIISGKGVTIGDQGCIINYELSNL